MIQSNASINESSGTKTPHATSRPQEGMLTRRIEEKTAKMPSVGWLGLAIGSMALSAALEVFSGKRKDPAAFVGLWVPTLLLFGIYNKLVKLEGSDRFSGEELGYKH